MKRIYNEKHAPFLLFLFSAWVFSWVPSLASERLATQGNAVILQGDQASARRSAIRDGQSRAIEKAVEQLITAEKVVEEYDLLSEEIFPFFDRYVQGFEVTTEGKTSARLWLEMAVEVDTDLLKQDLEKLGLLKSDRNRLFDTTKIFRLTLFDIRTPQLWDQFRQRLEETEGTKSLALRAFSSAAIICEVVSSFSPSAFEKTLEEMEIDGYRLEVRKEGRTDFRLRFVRSE